MIKEDVSSDFEIFEAVASDRRDVTFKENDVYLRDTEQNTPLSRCLRAPTHDHSLPALLEAGAASSVFVKGYAPGSLICTLPMAVQPSSSVFVHPPPIQTSPEVISQIDTELAQYVTQLHTRKVDHKFDVDRKDHILKVIYPDTDSKEHRLLRLLLQAPDSTAAGSVLANRYEKEYSENLSIMQIKDILLATHAVKIVAKDGKKVFRFSFLRDAEKSSYVPTGESVIVTGVVPTDCTEYMIAFENGENKQVSLENLRPLKATKKTAAPVSFSHPGCAALRSPDQRGGLKALQKCIACDGMFAKCSGSYGFRTKAGRWSAGVCQDPGDCPESPNYDFCTLLCEQHGAGSTATSPSMTGGGVPVRGKARLQLGDKVMLVANVDGSENILCLGFPVEKQVGVVVKLERPTADSSRDDSWKGRAFMRDRRGRGGRGRDSAGPAEIKAHVMALASGQVDAYSSSALRFADGSSIDMLPEATGSKTISIPDGKAMKATGSGHKRQFQNGDRVKLKSGAKDCCGCLGAPPLRWVGEVKSNQRRVDVSCYANSHVKDPNLTYPNYSYDASDLLLENEFERGAVQPLMVGERVKLKDGFQDNDGDGWCLGKADEAPKRGVVVFAPGARDDDSVGQEQRHIGVVAESNPSDVYWFRGSWLQRIGNEVDADNGGKPFFQVGSRVQLDPAKWAYSWESHGKKCLGKPSDAVFGLVVNAGVLQKDGSQRNMEVVAVTGSRPQAVSFYSSFDLITAHRSVVMTPSDRIYLVESIGRCMQDCAIDLESIDMGEFINTNGLDAWGALFQITNFSPKVTDAWFEWWRGLDPDWPDTSPILEVTKTLTLTPARVNPRKATWICSKEFGGKCKGRVNSGTNTKCCICGISAKSWKCHYCSTSNKAWYQNCVTCFADHEESEELRRVQLRAAQRIEEEKEQERQRLLEIEAEMLALKANEEKDIPEGRFVHPGSLNMCGGNPAGFAKCEGNGACSVGPNSCLKCGAGTHWTCCFSDDPESKYCSEGISQEQAVKHAKVLADASELRRRVSDIPGLVIEGGVDWSCPACTSLNPMTKSACEVCDTAAPENVIEKQREEASRATSSSSRNNERGSKGDTKPSDNQKSDLKKKFEGTLSETLQQLAMVLDMESRVVDVCKSRADEEEDAYDGATEEKQSYQENQQMINFDDSDSDDSLFQYGFDDDENEDSSYTYNSDSDLESGSDEGSLAPSIEKIKKKQASIPTNWEEEANALLSESYFHAMSSVLSPDSTSCESDLDNDMLQAPPLMNRYTSTAFFSLSSFEKLSDIDSLCNFADKNGNTACHHAAYIGLYKTYDALIQHGASRWQENKAGDTPGCLRDGFKLGTGSAQSSFHKILTKRAFISPELLPVAMQTAFDYSPPASALPLLDAILTGDDEYDASFLVNEAVADAVPHAKLYQALFSVMFQYGPMQAKKDLQAYESELVSTSDTAELDPLYYFVRFKLWTSNNGKMSSYAKHDRLSAYDALSALRCYPDTANKWLDPDEHFDEDVRQSGIESDDPLPTILDDDYSDLFPPLGPDDPETLWEKAKADYGLVSPSMDALMQLTGLKAVKHKAKDVCLTVLLDPPKDLQTGTSCNFTFIGNPGTGKTTVAELLSKAMSELKYRTNDTPVLTSADEILGANQPVAAFSQLVQDAEGGTLFIDEAYLFDPAPKGRTQNESNKVLNVLLKVAEKMRKTTTFILAGYKEEIQTLLGCNPGFPSRFPKTFTFDFADYNEAELTVILSEMTKRRNFRFESQKECGVPIARILARDIHMGAHVKGFGNGRECEKVLDLCIQNQMSRLVRWKENKIPISDNDYRTLTRKDTVGERPKLEDSAHMAELNAMVGLHAVKTKLRNLMNLQLQNYDAKMRGEKIQRISLHRVFYGNPGTGKTTVAKLLGKMLKEFRYLTDGDIITCTPADLKGSAVGEGVARTKALLDSAKGKVLFIDEAYNLDPARGSGTFGAEVLDVILEKIEANAGSDMCVILAGYKAQMEQLFRNVQNPGLKRRFNLGEAFLFEDFSDEEIRQVLKRQIVQAELYASPATLDHAVTLISQKRLEEGFGNAGEAEQMLNRAKLRHSARLSECKDSISDLKLLLQEDFDGEITSLEKAREAFADLENIDHVMSVLDSYEAMCSIADDENTPRHELLSDCHMLFLGPPGSGKTTMGKRFAMMFKQLNLLPSDRFEYTTAGNLIDRYVGGTGNNTVEAMRRAKGGVLMIDEAYAMLPHRNHFGGDVMQALLDNITTEEYKGKIIVILSGYKDDVEELFGLNPGFQSRFDKKRIEFPEWSGVMASNAVLNLLEREGKRMDADAREAMTGYFEGLRHLPNWASARDAMEWIKPSLDAARAERQFQVNQEKRLIQKAKEGAETSTSSGPRRTAPMKSKAARAARDPPLAYSIDDVRKVFTSAISARGGAVDQETGSIISTAEIGKIKSLASMVAFKEMQNTASRQKKLLIVCFTSPSTCQPCQNFEPLFDDIAAENTDVMFAKVYAEKGQSIFRKLEVQSVPHTMLFFNGAKTDEVLGCDPNKLKHVIISHHARQKKFQANTPAPPPPPPSNLQAPPSAKVASPSSSLVPQQLKEKDKVKVKVLKPDESVSDDDSDDDLTDDDAWAALEDACAELGYTLEQLRDMLSDASTFPPKELMDLVLKKVTTKNPNNVKSMLQKQRPGVLVKVTTAIAEAQRKQTEEEEQMQQNVQAIGKCPMGFTWHKEGAGWRCGGGSHFVSDYDIENYMYEQDMYG